MAWLDVILGRPLASGEDERQELSVATAIPVLGLDALASTGYGPEAALTILVPLGEGGLRYFPFIALAIVLMLVALFLSYRQTQAAYPNGGGAYWVAKDNLGESAGLWAAVALVIDYVLNVAVAISAGVGAVVSMVPALHPFTLPLCLGVLVTLTIVNLRGVRETGLAFIGPVFVFIGCMALVLAIGLGRSLLSHGAPEPVTAPPPLPPVRESPSVCLIFGALANGLTAMTGIEAVSNGIPLFKKPTVPRAQKTLAAITTILSLFLLGVGYLCPLYQVGAMDQQTEGYQTVLSQLTAAVVGRGPFYYVALASIFIVLTYSAQTSFADVPRVFRLLADDRFLPPSFAERGRRLVFTRGVIVLSIVSAILLIVFGGVTDKLIPLFAVGAFTAFLFSELGMVVHWLKRRDWRRSVWPIVYNGIGASTTAAALVIIVSAKFTEGAWLVIIVAPALVILLRRIRKHYDHLSEEIDEPLALSARPLLPPIAVVPIEGWNRVAEKALSYALLLSEDVVAIHVRTERNRDSRIEEQWAEKVDRPARAAHMKSPCLEIVDSPYRRIAQPILDFVERIERRHPDRLIAIVIPELTEPSWFEALLHNVQRSAFKTQLDLRSSSRTVLVYVPWRMSD